jgi:hypothetical protein
MKINILTRTYNRPEYFNICRESIINQTYKNINHVVGSEVDCQYCGDYISLSKKTVDKVRPKPSTYPAPWNLHLNEMNNHVKDGWIMYLDDDDMFVSETSLERIINYVDNENQLIIWQVDIGGFMVVPSNMEFGVIKPGNVSGIGFMFHCKHLPVDWGSWSYGDYRVINELSKKLEVVFIKEILTRTQGRPNNGKQPEPKK